MMGVAASPAAVYSNYRFYLVTSAVAAAYYKTTFNHSKITILLLLSRETRGAGSPGFSTDFPVESLKYICLGLGLTWVLLQKCIINIELYSSDLSRDASAGILYRVLCAASLNARLQKFNHDDYGRT